MDAFDAARDIGRELGLDERFGEWGEFGRIAVNVETVYRSLDPGHVDPRRRRAVPAHGRTRTAVTAPTRRRASRRGHRRRRRHRRRPGRKRARTGMSPAGDRGRARRRRRPVDRHLQHLDRRSRRRPSAAELVDVDSVVASGERRGVGVRSARRTASARTYATLDNDALRAALRAEVEHRIARVGSRSTRSPVVPAMLRGTDSLDDGRFTSSARSSSTPLAGPPGSPARVANRRPPWQTALGVVLPEPPSGDLGNPTFMDFRRVLGPDGAPSSVGPNGVTTFCYSLPMRDGWLVEETVLAARPAIEPIALLPRLAARLGRHPDSVLADAVRTEYVRIPLGGSRAGPRTADRRLRCCGRVRACCDRILRRCVDPCGSSSRCRHRVGAGGVLRYVDLGADRRGGVDGRRCDAPESCTTSASRSCSISTTTRSEHSSTAFFELSVDDWSAYLRVDASPREISAVMARLFRSSSWQLRRRLAGRNPASLARLLRP